MTPKISLVAVCCSKASVRSRLRASSSLNKPHVLDRDHRLIGEGFEKLDLIVGRRVEPRSGEIAIAPTEYAFAKQRRRQATSESPSYLLMFLRIRKFRARRLHRDMSAGLQIAIAFRHSLGRAGTAADRLLKSRVRRCRHRSCCHWIDVSPSTPEDHSVIWRHIAARRSRQAHRAPAEYQSANWRSRARSRSSRSAAPVLR